MQEELESARPLLAQAAKDTLATMEQLQVLLLDSPTVSICPPLTAHTDCRAWGGLAELARNRALSASTRAPDELSTVGIYTEQHCQGMIVVATKLCTSYSCISLHICCRIYSLS